MQEFFTWSMLGTYAGAVAVTTLVTQLFKGISFIDKMPTQVFSYLVAAIVLLVATIFTTGFTWAGVALSAINAVVVSFASNGTFEALLTKKTDE